MASVYLEKNDLNPKSNNAIITPFYDHLKIHMVHKGNKNAHTKFQLKQSQID